jgi:HPt (histidine-containing phosphotransfer) domain-containing protein
MIDWSRVRQLQQEVGAEDFDEVVELFLEEVEAVMARLASLPYRSQLGQDLHCLKGSALNLGFSAFSDLCHIGEFAAETGAADSIDVAQIIQCYAKSKETFLRNYRQQIAA